MFIRVRTNGLNPGSLRSLIREKLRNRGISPEVEEELFGSFGVMGKIGQKFLSGDVVEIEVPEEAGKEVLGVLGEMEREGAVQIMSAGRH